MTMRYRMLGRSGLRVSELCLGTMTFGQDWGWGTPPEECRRVLDGFAEAGGNFVDTASRYTEGASERILGQLLAADRDWWVLATKYGLNTRPDDPNSGGAARRTLQRSLEESLRRLGTDHVDLFYVHVWDVFTPVDEIMRALDDVVRAGKVRYVGISDTPAWVVAEAQTLADLRGWSRFAGLQVPYSLVERTPERELLPMARVLELTATTWGPLGGGVLSGRYGSDRTRPEAGTRLGSTGEFGRSALTGRNLRIADEVNAVAAARGVTAPQVAIAWVRAQARRSPIVPLIGARTRDQLDANLGALQLDLTAEELARLDEVSSIEPGFPHDFAGRMMAYGTTFDRVDTGRELVWPALGGDRAG